MIRFILLQNRQGKTRLSKWYVAALEEEKARIEAKVHTSVVVRERKWTNFLEFENYKLVYRQYADLYFIFCVDNRENELSILELIHLFVESLDSYFGNVCEVDLIFKFARVYHILDEFIIAGEISDTSKSGIVAKVKLDDKLE